MVGQEVLVDADSLEWEEWKQDIPFWRHAVAGSSAGVAEHIAMYPLDTVKTRLQAYNGTTSAYAFRDAVRAIMAERGVSGFVRGWPAIAGGCIPAHIALFSVYERCKLDLAGPDGKLSTLSAGLCGALATAAHDSILTPMDVVKQRLQLGCYDGVSDCVRRLVKSEGVAAFFRSLPTTLLINAPYGAVFVAANETLKGHLPQGSLAGHFITAGIAASVASLSTHPLDVVKTRLQTQDVLCKGSCTLRLNSAPKYPSFTVAVKTILREEGVNGFYRGLVPRALLSIPAAATCWGTYETVKQLLARAIDHR